MRLSYLAVMSGVCLAVAAPSLAKDKGKDDPVPTPAVFQAVIDCKAIAAAEARLACYDSTVAAMGRAKDAEALVVTDTGAIREARRGLFGISLPKLKLFGGGEEVNEIEGKITAVRSSNDGMAIFVLEDGARWRQTEGRHQFAKPGQTIKVRRASMGGFMANIDGQPGVRVVRMVN
ncbi:hypothetical protein B0I00_2575 [Novosphingobium kunmingense]|uniref:Uncharacterized protein n=1 Tax=Novosphingobium kunmingense TaxID=1211806 RepID=A0A2N0H4T9_9SPHN|nr:hypothetical protein [Novosphingobium kunmingense]PKB13947.1 hypothetical protein B0I00_2575 [Novosphingobium kunmingense]